MISKAQLQFLKSLSQKKIREEKGMFLVEGWRAVEEASAVLKEIELLAFAGDVKGNRWHAAVLASARKIAKQTVDTTPKEFSLFADTVTAQGIAAVVKTFTFDRDGELKKLSERKKAFVIALDQIADPGNLGAIIRTSDWFGLDAILLSDNCVELYNPKVVRSTVGSLFHLPFIPCSDTAGRFAASLMQFKKSGFTVFGAEVSGSIGLPSVTWADKSILVIGNEARGISPEISRILDNHVAIPKFGKAESLNAGVAAGIFLAHRSFQQ